MTRLSFSSLRVRLVLLVLVAVIPAMGLIFYTGWEQRKQAAAKVQENALRLARIAAGEHKHLIEGAHQLLIALGQLPPVRGRDAAACSALFSELLKQYPRYANLGVAGLDGKVFCSALSLLTPITIADRAYFQRALETREVAVGEYQIGRITGKASLNFAYPLLDRAGRIQAVVFAALDLAWLNRLAAEAELPPGSTLTVIDRHGTILVRYPNPDQWVGQSMPDAPVVKAIRMKGQGTAEVAGLDGVPRLYAFTSLGGGRDVGAYVSLGIPTAVVFAESDRTLARNLIGLGIVALLALVAAWVGGDLFILRQAKALVETTKRLAAGDLSARTGVSDGPGELNQLARAFDEMAEALERHLAERKRAEEELRSVNRALAVLSSCNQVLIRAKDESELLHDICRTIVEVGAYRLSWIGYAEQDDAKDVRPVAQWGYEEGYLDTLKITWADTERGRGPTGRAIRTGKPSVARSILTDPDFTPWRAEATKRGYASSIGLPLIAEWQTFGALNIYAVEPDAFDAKEVKLLAELADDLAFGIVSLRTRAERDQAEAALVTRTRQLEAMRAVTEEITRELNLKTLLGLIIRRAADLVGATSGVVYLWDEAAQVLVPRAWHGLGEWMGQVQLEPGDGIAGTVAQRREGLIVNDYRISPYAHPVFLQRTMVTATVSEPLLYRDRFVGVINVNHEGGGRAFSEEDRGLLALFAGQASIAIENARLYEELRLAAIQLEAKVEDRTRELQATNARLEEAMRQVQAASRHKSEFLANMSHELRTPLNSVLGFSQLLLEQTPGLLSEKQVRYLTNIHNSGKHLLQLISDILDISKVEAGKFVLQLEALPVAETLEDILVIGRGLAHKKSQTIVAEIRPNLPHVWADPVRFKQILFNLLSNAVKFTPDGGTITVTARRVTEDRRPELEPVPGPLSPVGCLEISVTDTGVGIKSEDLPRLFREFVQLETTQAQSHEGTGLGLALTKKLVELHGGRIWAESQGEGRGSTFTVVLPFAGPEKYGRWNPTGLCSPQSAITNRKSASGPSGTTPLRDPMGWRP